MIRDFVSTRTRFDKMDDNPYNTSIEWDQDLMPSLEFQSFEYDELENLFDAAFGVSSVGIQTLGYI